MLFGHHDIFAHTRPWPHSQRSSLQHKICKRQPNGAENWQQGYESVCFVAWYSFLYCRAGLDEVQMKQRCKWIWYTLVANFASRVSPCAEIVEPFKLLLHVTAHPQFFELELRAPMGTCPGQHGTAACGQSLFEECCNTYACLLKV